MGRKNLAESRKFEILSMISDCEIITRDAAMLIGGADRWKQQVLKDMEENELICQVDLKKQAEESSEKGTWGVSGKIIKMTPKGGKLLNETNEIRYRNEVVQKSVRRGGNLVTINRVGLISECICMAEQAGYCVNPLDKPSVFEIPNFYSGQPADSEIVREFSEGGRAATLMNFSENQYYTKDKTTRFYQILLDKKIYRQRRTPIGCFYTSTELKQMAQDNADKIRFDENGLDMIRGSRMSGVLFSSFGSYMIYNSHRAAPKIRCSVEASMRFLVNQWTQEIYQGTLTDMRKTASGEAEYDRVVPEARGNIVMGEKTCQTAVNIVFSGLLDKLYIPRSKIPYLSRKLRDGNYNLREMPNSLFLPVVRDSVYYLAYMMVNHWQVFLNEFALSYITCDWGRENYGEMMIENISELRVIGTLEDNRTIYNFLVLSLDDAVRMFADLYNNPDSGALVIASESTKKFWDKIETKLKPMGMPMPEVLYIPQSDVNDFCREVYQAMGLDFIED